MLRPWLVRFGGHRVDVVGQSFQSRPRPPPRLAAELGFRATRGPRGSPRGDRAELVHHRVDRVLQLEDSRPGLDGDLLGEVPVETAVVTSAMLRTWLVSCWPSVDAVVRSFHVPARPSPRPGRRASLPCRLAGHAVTSEAKAAGSWSTIVLIVPSAQDLPPHVDGDLLERSRWRPVVTSALLGPGW